MFSLLGRFDEKLGFMFSTDTGRTASTFYVKYDTIEVFNEFLKPFLNEAQILGTISKAQEFEQIKVSQMSSFDWRSEDCSKIDLQINLNPPPYRKQRILHKIMRICG